MEPNPQKAPHKTLGATHAIPLSKHLVCPVKL